MDDQESLEREIRAAREELARRRTDETDEFPGETSRLPLMPDRDEEFLRLAVMSSAELESHIERLERDLADLQEGFDRLDVEESDATG